MRNTLLWGTVALTLAAAPAFAQATNPSTQQPTTRSGAQSGTRVAPANDAKATNGPSQADHDFVMEAAKGGMAEVELGKLAAEKAASSEVKQFGQKMANDHGKGNDELKSLAKSKNILLPTTLDPKERATKDRLSKLSGEEFDRAYMREMLKDHRTDIAEFQHESKSGHDADIKAWASKTLPTLQEHLKDAQSTNRMVATAGSKKGKSTGTSGTVK
jgi:putative membrane protein